MTTEDWRARAERAEAALDRVRAIGDRSFRHDTPEGRMLIKIFAAVDGIGNA